MLTETLSHCGKPLRYIFNKNVEFMINRAIVYSWIAYGTHAKHGWRVTGKPLLL